jgi:hypothetical protein
MQRERVEGKALQEPLREEKRFVFRPSFIFVNQYVTQTLLRHVIGKRKQMYFI